jgi:DNA-binding HxlR family transcriptional regulator
MVLDVSDNAHLAPRRDGPRPFVQLLAGRWALAVLTELASGGRRYQDLHDALDGISYRVLTQTLRRAEHDELIARHLDPGGVETAKLYELTELGQFLDAPLAVMAEWAKANWQAVEAARQHGDRLCRRESGRSEVRHLTSPYGLALRGTAPLVEVPFHRVYSWKCRLWRSFVSLTLGQRMAAIWIEVFACATLKGAKPVVSCHGPHL